MLFQFAGWYVLIGNVFIITEKWRTNMTNEGRFWGSFFYKVLQMFCRLLQVYKTTKEVWVRSGWLSSCSKVETNACKSCTKVILEKNNWFWTELNYHYLYVVLHDFLFFSFLKHWLWVDLVQYCTIQYLEILSNLPE